MGRALPVLAVALIALPAWAQQPAARDDDQSIAVFLHAVESAIATNNREAWVGLLSPEADRGRLTEFFETMVPRGVTRAVVQERDRVPLGAGAPGEGYRIVAEVFFETGPLGRIASWRFDVRRGAGAQPSFQLVGASRLSSMDGLHRLSLHPDKQFAARDLTIRSTDLELRLPRGDAFVAETADGVTALVLLGDGVMTFTPRPIEERGQVRIFAGADRIDTGFTVAFIRLSPFEFERRLAEGGLVPVKVDPRAFRRANAVFAEDVVRSFGLDLGDLSRDFWSFVPPVGDFLAEIRTRRFDTLTYVRSAGEAEDISVFQRARRRNIVTYASEEKLASRGPFYSEDDLAEYDVLNHQIDATFDPDREWLEGRSRLTLRINASAVAALTLRLADGFVVESVTSDRFERLLCLRVRGRNSVVIDLPSPVARDLELTLTIRYRGRITRQALDDESIALPPPEGQQDMPPEPNWFFSNRSYWYPQGLVTDYATATIRFTVPSEYAVVASGNRAANHPDGRHPGRTGPVRPASVRVPRERPGSLSRCAGQPNDACRDHEGRVRGPRRHRSVSGCPGWIAGDGAAAGGISDQHRSVRGCEPAAGTAWS